MAEEQKQEEQKQEKKVRVHKTLGEYKKVTVEWKEAHKANLDIFVSINNYTVTFKPETEVEIPVEVARFLKDATYEEHYFDEKEKKHATRSKKKYFVELV